jgi:hypothetical protein
MFFAVLVLGALIAGTAYALKVRARAHLWIAEVTEVGFIFVHVRTLPVSDGVTQTFELTLHGSSRPHVIDRILVSADAARRVGLDVPSDFAPAPDDEDGDKVWTPKTEVILEPLQPRRFTFRFTAGRSAPAHVTLSLRSPVKVGGVSAGVNLRVPVLDPLAIEAANLRADIGRRARQLGVAGSTLPEWPKLRAMERELGEA